ncbi:MAG: HIT domain-containing protein [Myxococcales bacterium]
MEQLWAPWRMELISKGEPAAGCIFCDLPRAKGGRDADRDNLVLGRTQHAFALLNKYPYNNGHLMVVPRRHTADLGALDEAEHRELAEMLRVAHRLLGKAYAPHGANLGMNLGRSAGAGIADHLHWHVVPRWAGDTNFMPVVGATKVMIEHLRASWEKLRPLFEAEFHCGDAGAIDSW